MKKYLENPFVVLGTLGLVYYVWNRKKIMAKLPVFKKSENPSSTVKESIDKFLDIPENFRKQVEKMNVDEIKKTIKSNTEMLSRKKIGEDEKAGIERMLEYLNSKVK